MSGRTGHGPRKERAVAWARDDGVWQKFDAWSEEEELVTEGGCSDHNITKRWSLVTHILRDEVRSEPKQLKRRDVDMRRIRLRIPDRRVLLSA